MKRSALCAAAVLGPMLLLGACTSDQQASVNMLNWRLQTSLKPELADGRAVVQPTADGAVVTLLDGTKLPDDEGAMDNRERDPRASIIEGLLTPEIIQLAVTDTGNSPEPERQKRVDSFVRYLQEFRLSPSLQAASATPVALPPDAPAGLAVAIRVVCPPRTIWPGYGQGQSDPSCH